MASTDNRKATEDLVKCFRDVFKKYSRGTRQKAFDRIFSAKGRDDIHTLVVNPDRSVGLFRNLITFKEWYAADEIRGLHRQEEA